MKKISTMLYAATVSSLLTVVLTMPVNAEGVIYYVKDGTTDWTKPSSYINNLNNSVPGKEDIVVVSNKFTVTVSSDDPESWKIVSSLRAIRPVYQESKIIFDVAEGMELTNNAAIYNPEGSINGFWGKVVKRGEGTLVLGSSNRHVSVNAVYDYKAGSFIIEKGMLKFPQNTPKRELQYGNIHIEKDAVLVLTVFDTTQGGSSMLYAINGSLTGEGTIINGNPGKRQLRVYKKSVFSGTITGPTELFISGEVDLLGVENSITEIPMVWTYPDSAPGVIGVKKFGMKADLKSSIGSADVFMIDTRGGGYKYLGEGNETTDKELKIADSSVHPASMDGGIHGGLTFTGSWSMNTSPNHMHTLVLKGENPDACVLENDISDWHNGTSAYSFQIVKYGSGIWRFADCASRTWSGSLNVREGTVQFDSLCEAGELCSLGKATNTYTPSIGDSRVVDYAISLGGINESGRQSSGTVEYTGTGLACSASRRIVLDGEGGAIKGSKTGELAISGVGTIGTGARTLTLDAASGTTNYLQNLDEGEATVSLVKTGGGTWILQGRQSFSGDLTVSNGTVAVRDIDDNYTWFRFIVKRVAGNHDYFNAVEMAFYDEEGVQQFYNPVRVEPVPRSSNTWVWCKGDYRALNPGEVSFGKPGWYKNQWYKPSDFRDFGVLFDRNAKSGQPSVEIYYGGDGETGAVRKFNPENSDTWLHIVMRMPENSRPIASYDMMSSSTYGRERRPNVFTLEGSRDGVFWTKLHDVSWGNGIIGTGDVSTGEYQWMSDGSTTASTPSSPAIRPDCGWRLSYPDVSDEPQLINVGRICVSAGASLIGDGSRTISSLLIDAKNGAGLISGFKIAKDGMIEIENYERTSEVADLGLEALNVDGLSNLSGWQLAGANLTGRKILVRDNRVCVAGIGMSVVIR